MYFLKKKTVFFKLPGSGIFHYPPGAIGLQMFMPPRPDIATPYLLQSPQAGLHRFLRIRLHSNSTWGWAM